MDDRRRTAVSAVAAARLGYGTLMTLAPRRMLRLQVGGDPAGPAVWLARVFGVRDALLGAGVLVAPDGPDRRRWVAFGAVADAADLASAVVGFRWLARRERLVVSLAAAGATATAAWALSSD